MLYQAIFMLIDVNMQERAGKMFSTHIHRGDLPQLTGLLQGKMTSFYITV